MSPRDLLLLTIAASLPAQSSFTLPNGYESRPGDGGTVLNQPWATAESAFLYIDYRQAGPTRVGIRGVELRRDELGHLASAARSSDVTIRIGYAAPESALLGGFEQSFRAGTAVTVTSGRVQLPATTPLLQPWGQIALPFMQPFTYDPRSGGLVIELRCRDTTPAAVYSLDCTDGTDPGVGSVAYLDPNDLCFTQNGSMDLVQQAPRTDASGLVTVDSHALRAPANAPSVLILGLESAAPTPLLCATLRATPEIAAFPLVANATGSIGSASMPNRVTFPFPGTGFSLAAQYASLDPTRTPIPGVLSDAARFSVVGHADRNHVYRLSAPVAGAVTGLLTRRDVPVLRFLLP